MKKQGLLGCLVLATLAVGALWCGVSLWPPRAGEPWALRWARTAASHPLRTGLALALLLGSGFRRQPTRIPLEGAVRGPRSS